MSTQSEYMKLPVLRNDKLIFEDTSMAPTTGGICPCLMCGKPFIMRVFIGIPDQLCGECSKTYEDTAKVVCARCKPPVTICRLKPGIIECGYYIRPKAILHVDRCNICDHLIREGVMTTSTIIEIEAWMKNHRPRKLILTTGQ